MFIRNLSLRRGRPQLQIAGAKEISLQDFQLTNALKKRIRAVEISTLAAIFVACTANAAEGVREPMAVIDALVNRIYVLGETKGEADEMIAAEAKAAEEIRLYLASGATEGLLSKDKSGRSALSTAAYMGYPNIVAALLISDLVKEHINDADESGITPWIASVMSMRQSAWSCNPKIFEDPFKFVPMLVTQPYYLSTKPSPYKKVRDLLEQAGASSSMEQAKSVWLTNCKLQSDEGRDKVQRSMDMQKTVQFLGAVDLVMYENRIQENKKTPKNLD